MATHDSGSDGGVPLSNTRRQTICALGGLLIGTGISGTAAAGGKPTPIEGPTTITDPGRYELVDDFTATGGNFTSIISIAADDVHLDDNGYSIRKGDVTVEEAAVSIGGVEGCRVTDLHLRSAGGFRIGSAERATVANCSSTGSDSGLLLSGSSKQIKVRRCEFAEGRGVRVIADETDSKIVNNEIHDNRRWGIQLSGTSGNSISGNDIVDNGDYGIRISSSDGNRITGNYICGHEEAISEVEGSEDNKIQGNRIC